MKTILPFIQKRVVVLHDDAPIRQAARAMKEHGIGCVVVSDHAGHITGIATDRDLVNGALADQIDVNRARISDVMTRDPVTVEESATIRSVVELMEKHGIRRIPVTHPATRSTVKCIGIVTLDDLALSRSVDSQHVMRILRAQLKRRVFPSAPKKERGVNARKELARFYDSVGGRVSPQLELNREEIELLSIAILGALTRRLHHTGALQLIGQLPSPVQTELLELPPGPDKRADSARLMVEVQKILEVEPARASTAILRFCSALEDWCDAGVLEHIKAQLPTDLQKLFGQVKSSPARLKRAA